MENNKEFTTKCIDCLDFYYIFNSANRLDNSPNDSLNNIKIIIIGITEEDEINLSNNKSIFVEKGNNQFDINPENCIAFGDLDLSPNSKDIKTLCNLKIFDKFDINICVFSKYNYDTHTVTSDVKGGRWYTTKNPNEFLPYIHGCIGKPERVVIFKEYKSILSKTAKNKNNKRNKNQNNKENEPKITNDEKRKEKISKYKFKIKMK